MSRGLRTLLLLVAVAATVALLFLVVFPWFDETFVNDPVLGGPVSERSERRYGPSLSEGPVSERSERRYGPSLAGLVFAGAYAG